MSQALIVYVVILAAVAWTSSAILAGQDAPFLAFTDQDAVCTAAVNYQPQQGSPGDAATHTATSTDTAAIRTNASTYRPGQPLLGLYLCRK